MVKVGRVSWFFESNVWGEEKEAKIILKYKIWDAGKLNFLATELETSEDKVSLGKKVMGVDFKHVWFELMVKSQLGLFKKTTEEKEWIKIKQSSEKMWKLQ